MGTCVSVFLDVGMKICRSMPRLSLDPPPPQDIRNVVLHKLPEIESVPKIMVHYINMVRYSWLPHGQNENQ